MKAALIKYASQPASWLVIVLLLVNLPHFERYENWSIISIFILASFRLYNIGHAHLSVNRLLVILITFTLVVLTYRQYQTLNGIEAGTNLLSLMLFCKLLESKSQRDHTILILLSFFVVSTNFLFSQSIGTAIYMVFCLVIILITLITLNQHNATLTTNNKARTALRMIGYSIPVMLILFVFFPRISGSLWKTNTNQSTSRTGLSDHMEPGNISKLIKSASLAFRVKFDQETPAQQQLYWRSITLWRFDGRRWDKADIAENLSQITIGRTTYDYTITAEPSNQKWLFLLDTPYAVSDNLTIAADFTTESTTSLTSIYQYKASSALQYRMTSTLEPRIKEQALQLPGINQRTIELARQWTEKYQEPEQIINKALQYFSQNNFTYSLQPPLLTSSNTVDQFLFQTRQGFCEHYASAFAILMRAAGIPARVVIGYQGGDINSLNNYMSIDQSMAHAWNEVWLEGRGWTRVDPTSIIAPERIQENLSSAIKNTDELPFQLRWNFKLLEQLGQYFDLIDNQWNQWVINYNASNQKRLLEFLSGEKLDLKAISYLFIQILLGTLAITALLFYWRQNRRKINSLDNAYQEFCQLMQKYGYEKMRHEGPTAYCERLLKALPLLRVQITQILNLYITIRYRSDNSNKNIEYFQELVRSFKSRASNHKILKSGSVEN